MTNTDRITSRHNDLFCMDYVLAPSTEIYRKYYFMFLELFDEFYQFFFDDAPRGNMTMLWK